MLLKLVIRIGLLLLLSFSHAAFAVDVLVNLTDAPDPAIRGGEITYTITTQNQANDIAPNVTLSFPLPATTTFVSVDSTQCTHNGGSPGTVNCNFGNLQGTALGGGDIKIIHVVVITGAATPSTINNIVATSATTGDTNTSNDSNTPQNTTIDDGADLTTTLTASPDPVIAGGDVTYTAVLTNNGFNIANSIQVVFQLSVNTTYVSSSASGTGWLCNYNSGNHQLTCAGTGAGTNLASGDSAAAITFKAKVTGAQTGQLAATATVSSTTNDPIPNNNVISANVTVNEGTDVAVTLFANPTAVIENQTTTVTLKPRNLGPFDAAGVDVTYTAPPGFSYNTTPSGTGWTCNVDGGNSQQYHCTRPTYTVGSTDDISFTLIAPAYSAGNKLNTVTISTTTDEATERLANNTANLNMTLEHDGVDLSISKIKTPTPVAQNSSMTSTISVTNHGPLNAAAGTITVTDVLDVANVTYGSFSGTNWSCTFSSFTVTCVYNAAVNNGAQSSDLVITTIATGIGTISNTATVAYSGTPGDYNSSNNSTTKSVISTNSASNSTDLIVTKLVDADNADGDITTLGINENSLTYTINIQNNGPSAATGITLTDAIPGYVSNASGTTGISFSNVPPNYSCSSSAQNVTCTQTSGTLANSATDTIDIIVIRPLLDGAKTNTATAFSADQGDPDRSNNTGSINVTIDPVADIVLQSKTVTPSTVKSGTNATYQISLKNNGPSTAQSVVVTDIFTLPVGDTGFTFISSSASGGGSCIGLNTGQIYTQSNTPTLVCSWASIASGSTRTISMIIRPNYLSGSPDNRIFTNTVSAVTDTHESDTTNNSIGPITLTVNADEIDLLINNNDTGQDPLGHDPANSGDNINNDVTFELDYVNRGPSLATSVTIDYTLTPKAGKTLRFRCDEANSADACGTSIDKCTILSGPNPVTGNASGTATLVLRCSMPDMIADSNLHLKRYLKFRVLSTPDGLGDTHDTNAHIFANEIETITANNTEPEDVTVRGKVDLAVTKTASKATVELTEPFNWIITVTNNGPSDSFSADLVDTLPANMSYHGVTPSWNNPTDNKNGTCSVSGQNLTCDFGTNGAITNGASVVVSVPVMVTNYVNATEQNCATASTNGTGVDPNSSNNTNICGSVAVTNSYFPSDYGDAPDTSAAIGNQNYATTFNFGGPRHMQPGGTWLGACVDSDGAGTQQNITATDDDLQAGIVEAGTCSGNDDEDGISLPPAFIAGQQATIDITVTGSTCALDAWIDYNQNGSFEDAGEQIFNAELLTVGVHSKAITIPTAITVGDSYARFRCSTAGGLSSTEETTGGEVEDYLVSLQPDATVPSTAVDYGDAPDNGSGVANGNYQTLASDNGPSHILGVTGSPYLGSCVDSDNVTAQNINADADDLAAAGGVTSPVTTGTCATAGDDEDGVILNGQLQQGFTASIDVTASTGTNACILNAWIDYNQNGSFADAGEQIASNTSIAAGTTTTLTPAVPATAISGATYARFRCASTGGLSSTGAAIDGEVEDYKVVINPNLANTPVDFGDAPDSYGTLESNDGARHALILGAPYLGSCVDSDGGTAQSAGADADDTSAAGGLALVLGTCNTAGDEDGVIFNGQLQQNTNASIGVTASTGTGACILNAWIDYNQNGSFADAGEQIASNTSIASGTTTTLTPTVPVAAATGATYARFRCASTGELSPTGTATDGEVEDYKVIINPNLASTSVDFGDAPDSYGTLESSNGARHTLIPGAPYLGSCVDADGGTAQSAGADADDTSAAGGLALVNGSCATAGNDEDGVIFNGQLQQNTTASIDVMASIGTNACILSAWIDYNQNGSFSDAGEQIASNTSIAAGTTTTLTPAVPATALSGATYARFRCASTGGLSSTGAAIDGEVEDYKVVISPNLANASVDFGDAPDSYGTLESSDGARHTLISGAPYLGSCVDADGGAAQSAGADADDTSAAGGLALVFGTCNTANDDEDGVEFPGLMYPGQQNAKITVTTANTSACTLSAWIDFDQNGTFSGSAEQVISNATQAPGVTTSYTVSIPGNTIIGSSYARFRCSSESNLSATGAAVDGEVEDYVISISASPVPKQIPTLSQWGLFILLLMVYWISYQRVTLKLKK